MAGNYSHTTRSDGTVLTANIYNTDHQNHIDNATPAGLDDYSATVSQMRSTADPGESGSESQATSLAGEVERLRFIIKEITGKTYWYETPDASIADIGVITTRGDLIRGGASGVIERVALGTNNYYLASDGTDAVWQALDASDLATGTVPSARITALSAADVGGATGGAASGVVNAATDVQINGASILSKFESRQASTSGTAITFAISEGDRIQITVMLDEVGFGASDHPLIQLSTSSTYKTTGYTSRGGTGGSGAVSSTSGFILKGPADAAKTTLGTAVLTHEGGNIWSMRSITSDSDGNMNSSVGFVSLGGELDGVRVTGNAGGSFDAGNIGVAHMGGISV